MAKEKTASSYAEELKEMIKARNGECQIWLGPQIRMTALNMVIIDKLQKELEDIPAFVAFAKGSTGQMQKKIDPRLAHYDKMQRTLLLQYEAIGLNYNSMPSKITEPTRLNSDESDGLSQRLDDINSL